MPEALLLNDREFGSPEAAILSTRSITPVSTLDASAGTGAVFATPGGRTPARPLVSCGLANWRVSVSDATAQLPTWFLPSVKALVDLLNLPAGWNSYSAKRIAPQNAKAALVLLGNLLDFDTPPPAVVPRVQGNIQLEWHTDHIDIEIYIDSPENVRFFAEDATKELFSEGPLVGREKELRGWLERLASD